MTPKAEAVGLEPTSGVVPPPVFKTGSRAPTEGWSQPDDFRFPCSKLRGLESNQRPPGSGPGVTTNSDCPGSAFIGTHLTNSKFGEEGSNLRRLVQSQEAYH
jgi:hypothetical protein